MLSKVYHHRIWSEFKKKKNPLTSLHFIAYEDLSPFFFIFCFTITLLLLPCSHFTAKGLTNSHHNWVYFSLWARYIFNILFKIIIRKVFSLRFSHFLIWKLASLWYFFCRTIILKKLVCFNRSMNVHRVRTEAWMLLVFLLSTREKEKLI